jgi:glycosyltransferase involved in cell wall biosynthesis
MKIAVVVHGRFFAFDLARELIQLGHEVTLLTNYPKHVVARFGVPETNVRSFLVHGIGSRVIHRLGRVSSNMFESILHGRFSRWAARQVSCSNYGVVVAFSGVAEELFTHPGLEGTLKVLVRGSAHIREQARLLEQEQQRVGGIVETPSPWMVDREEREYSVADRIVVLSSFAKNSFVEQGVPREKLWVVPLAAEVEKFRPDVSALDARLARIRDGAPLNVLTVGTFSYRKGVIDLANIAKRLEKKMRFRFVGAIGDASKILADVQNVFEIVPKQPEEALVYWYAWADIFLFPTVEDGYAVVLAQAFAAGLPILASTNCGAADLITNGETGWIMPARCPEAFIDKLLWCDDHREELIAMSKKILKVSIQRGWREVAGEFSILFEKSLKAGNVA